MKRYIMKHIRDGSKVICAIVFSKLMLLKKNNRDIWLISERYNEAEDNGYFLFKYIRENYPKMKVYYLIDKKSNAYKHIKEYGNIIKYNSLNHYIYYFAANKHISAFQFFGVPETPIIWALEKHNMIKNKKIFLQHGVTKEMLPFLKYENTKYDLFICAGKAEYEYVKKNYGYPNQNVKYLGFCRYDNLHQYNLKNQILIMPTWRQWIGMTNKQNNIEDEKENFINTEYFKKYQSLLNNKELKNILIEKNIELIFYPHPEMQRFTNIFQTKCRKIKIIDRREYNLQKLLKDSQLIITDYSSVAFDVAYMKKPLIYYQFDKEKYYTNHFEKGYFDCEKDGFGPVVESEESLIKEIKNTIYFKSNRDSYIKRSKVFFQKYDMLNCERNYNAIKEL